MWDFEKAIRLCRERYGEPIGEGRHRIVFSDGDYVVKCPTKESGVAACWAELNSCDEWYAKTSLDPLSAEVYPIQLVRMEYVHHMGYSATPDWTWSIDCGQVGYTMDGRLVAYDWEHY